jgi:hypothetical protein
VQTYQISVSKGRDRVDEIRSALFAFPEVLDVFVTGGSDSLVVVCWGRPRLGAWLRAVRAAGYEVPARRFATATGAPDSGAGLPLCRPELLHNVVQLIHAPGPEIEQARRPDAA